MHKLYYNGLVGLVNGA